jgi:hypothetical protein
MNSSSPIHDPPVGMGATSVVLGSVGLLLFFMPILGIPLSAVGLLFGVVGLLMAIGGRSSLRWSPAGAVLCCLALGVGIAIAVVASHDLPDRSNRQTEQDAAERLYIPPPAPPNWLPQYR